MKKYFIFLFALFCTLNLNAEGPRSRRKSNPNYKNLKLYVKLLEHYGKSDFYLAQIDIVNSGKNFIAFWENPDDYSQQLSFSAGGVCFVNKSFYQYYEKYKTYLPGQRVNLRKVGILPHARYRIKMPFYIFNKKSFLKSNKNIRVCLLYSDANLNYFEDESLPNIISENTINYKW
jgi:hypothetical protein